MTLDHRALFDHLPGRYLVAAADEALTVVAVTDAFLQLHGAARGALIGHSARVACRGLTGGEGLVASLERVLRSGADDVGEPEPDPTGPGWSQRVTSRFGSHLLYRLDALPHHAERALFKALVDNSSDFIGIADPSGKPVYVNPAGRRMVGLAPDFPVGQTHIPEYYPPEQRAFVNDVIVKSMVERGHWRGETFFRNFETQAAIPVSDEHFMIRDPQSKAVLGMGTITRDISELTHAWRKTRELLEASSAISNAMAQAPDLVEQAILEVIVEHAGRLCDAGLSAAGLGLDPSRPFDAWAHAGLAPQTLQALGRAPRPVGLLARAEGETRSTRHPDVSRASGVPPHMSLTAFMSVPIRYRERVMGSLFLANKQGAAGFTEDDQRLAEVLAARAGITLEVGRLYRTEATQREWLEAVVQQIPEPVKLIDAKGNVVAENEALRDLRGESATLDLHETQGAKLPFEDLPLQRALTREEVTRGRELLAYRTGQKPLPVQVTAAPVRAAGGELAGATMVVQDLSAQKALEQLREEWAAIVAHDLQQPINAIGLRSDLLLRSELNEKQHKDVEQIRSASRRLSRMVQDLMDASQLETHRLQMRFDTVELGSLLRSAADATPELAARTVVTVPGETVVKGDAQRLEQVLSNLLGNALKYGAAGTPIRVELKRRDGRAEIAVTNQGPGIPPGEVPFLFERYFRSQAAREGQKKGSGLGLYIAKELVAAHQGTLTVASTPGETTTFTVSLPVSSLTSR
jgi:PAS domain S-box-containing protein